MDREARAPGRSRGCCVAELYNEERPHAAIGHKVPISLLNPDAHQARHREQAGKLYSPVVQRMGSEQNRSRL